jgi:hypothetical protein
MPAQNVEFGYYPHHCDFAFGPITVRDLPTREEVVATIETSEGIHDGWIYAPARQQQDFMTGEITTLPYSSRVFGLPKTHVLSHGTDASEEHLQFLVWCLSFFVGMRLTTTEAGFLDATPIKPGKLNDFVLTRCTLVDGMSVAEHFWKTHASDGKTIKGLISIIHALFISQNPRYLNFEEFMFLYTALDACFALTKRVVGAPARDPNHAERIDWMCTQFGIPTPEWAQPSPSRRTELSLVRNPTLHEGLFFDEPLGFAIYGGNPPSSGARNVPLEVCNLICRRVVALLGEAACDYVKSPVNTRQRHGLALSTSATKRSTA